MKVRYSVILSLLIYFFSGCNNSDYSVELGLHFLDYEYKTTLQSIDEFYKEVEKIGLKLDDLKITEKETNFSYTGKTYYVNTDNVDLLRLIRRLNSFDLIERGIFSKIYIKLRDRNNNEYIAITPFPKEIFGKITWRNEVIDIDRIEVYSKKTYCIVIPMDDIRNSKYYTLTRKDILDKYFIRKDPAEGREWKYQKWKFIENKWPVEDENIFTYILLHNGFDVVFVSRKIEIFP